MLSVLDLIWTVFSLIFLIKGFLFRWQMCIRLLKKWCYIIWLLKEPLSLEQSSTFGDMFEYIFLDLHKNKSTKLPLWYLLNNLFFRYSVSVCPSTSVRLVSRLAMPAGSFTAWNMGSSRTAGSPVTSQLEEETIPSTPSSWRLDRESTSPEQFLLTWSPLSSVNSH